MTKPNALVHIAWLTMPILAVLLVGVAIVNVAIPANLRPISNINDCMRAEYPNKVLPTGQWQCETPDGRLFTD
jgi:hypothetical protein